MSVYHSWVIYRWVERDWGGIRYFPSLSHRHSSTSERGFQYSEDELIFKEGDPNVQGSNKGIGRPFETTVVSTTRVYGPHSPHSEVPHRVWHLSREVSGVEWSHGRRTAFHARVVVCVGKATGTLAHAKVLSRWRNRERKVEVSVTEVPRTFDFK